MIRIKNIEQLPLSAELFLKKYSGFSIIAFYGEMGAGKTTFIKEICKNLQVIDQVNSPTFSIINEYHTKKGEVIYHFDFYRLKNEEELFDLGYEDYFYSGNLCLIEWPEKIEKHLPAGHLKIQIQIQKNGIREISKF